MSKPIDSRWFYLRHTSFLLNPKLAHIKINDDLLTLRARSIDGYIVTEVYGNHDYRFSSDDIPSGGVIVDLGAHTGIFSVWAARTYQPKKLICIEPEPSNLRLLEENLKQNKISAVVKECALSTDDTGASLKRMRMNTGGHILANIGSTRQSLAFEHAKKYPLSLKIGGFLSDQGSKGRSVDVPTATLDELLKDLKTVDFMKVDIEGSEVHLLSEPNLSVLADKVKRIRMEVHLYLDISIELVKSRLEPVGFKIEEISQPAVKGRVLGLIEATNTNLIGADT